MLITRVMFIGCKIGLKYVKINKFLSRLPTIFVIFHSLRLQEGRSESTTVIGNGNHCGISFGDWVLFPLRSSLYHTRKPPSKGMTRKFEINGDDLNDGGKWLANSRLIHWNLNSLNWRHFSIFLFSGMVSRQNFCEAFNGGNSKFCSSCAIHRGFRSDIGLAVHEFPPTDAAFLICLLFIGIFWD